MASASARGVPRRQRAEKNAVIVQDKGRGAEHANAARSHLRQSILLQDELTKLVGADLATPEGKIVSELGRAMSDFESNQKEVLQLAVVKSVLDASTLLYGDLYGRKPGCKRVR